MSQGPIGVATPPSNATSIISATNTLIKTGAGVVTSVAVTKSQGGASMTVYDGIDATGKLLATVDLNNFGVFTPPSPIAFAVGLFVVTSGLTTGSVTFGWR